MNLCNYVDRNIGYIVTGNLGIIKDRKLQKLIAKRPSYREQGNINYDTNLNCCIEVLIRDYKTEWARQEKVDTRVLDEWEVKVITKVRENQGNWE